MYLCRVSTQVNHNWSARARSHKRRPTTCLSAGWLSLCLQRCMFLQALHHLTEPLSRVVTPVHVAMLVHLLTCQLDADVIVFQVLNTKTAGAISAVLIAWFERTFGHVQWLVCKLKQAMPTGGFYLAAQSSSDCRCNSQGWGLSCNSPSSRQRMTWLAGLAHT